MIALEPIYAALWAKVANIGGFGYTSRRARMPQDLSDGQFPALMMEQLEADPADDGSGRGTAWTMPVSLIIYTNSGADPNVAPAIELNTLLDQVRAAIAPAIPGDKQTLGGLVRNVYINGKVEVFEGKLGQFGIAILPVHIIAAES